MINIFWEGDTPKQVIISFEDNQYYKDGGYIGLPLNSTQLVLDDSDIFTVKTLTNKTIFSGKWQDVNINGQQLNQKYMLLDIWSLFNPGSSSGGVQMQDCNLNITSEDYTPSVPNYMNIGCNEIAGVYGLAYGTGNKAGKQSISIGNFNNSYGPDNIQDSAYEGLYNVTIGYGNKINQEGNQYNTLIGYNNQSNSIDIKNSILIGSNNTATNNNSVLIGNQVESTKDLYVNIGNKLKVTKNSFLYTNGSNTVSAPIYVTQSQYDSLNKVVGNVYSIYDETTGEIIKQIYYYKEGL